MRSVVVTGTSTGIGWGTTKVLIARGFRVFGSVRKKADAARLSAEFGAAFVPLVFGVTDEDAGDRLQHGNDVGGFGHRCRALLDQAVGSLRARIQRRTGHGEDLAALVERTARGDQRAGTLGGLDDDDAER